MYGSAGSSGIPCAWCRGAPRPYGGCAPSTSTPASATSGSSTSARRPSGRHWERLASRTSSSTSSTPPTWPSSIATRSRSSISRSAWPRSVEDLEGFWGSLWDWFGIGGAYERVLARREMPGAEWFPGAELNYAEHVFRPARPGATAIVHASESQPLSEITWDELREQVARCAAGLRRLGVRRGDRVVAYMPNVPETVVTLLATASLGAVWSSCAPEFGTPTVVDRFKQIEPKVLIATEGYRYGGRDFDRRDRVAEIRAAIPSIEHTVMVPGDWEPLLADPAELAFERLPFDHPLWVLYSSGTTGLPKAIVQGQGGILLEHLKKSRLHSDLGPGDRFFWFTTTGWMMWNFLLGGLLSGAAIVLYDGQPDHDRLWRFAVDAGVTTF